MAEARPRIFVNAVGDVSLEVPGTAEAAGEQNPFSHILSVLADADIVFGNLETVLSERGDLAQKAVTISVPPERARWLQEAGFSVLNVANNHILDRGLAGLEDTLQVLNNLGIPFVGVSTPGQRAMCTVLERQGLKVGFLGYCESGTAYQDYELHPLDEGRILRDLALARTRVDLVVISLHWGTENVYYPSPEQIALAHRLVDAGAALVLGHHPHALQAIEAYNGGLIAYSLGNFQFICGGRRRPVRNDWTGILRVGLDATGVREWRLIPVEIGPDACPRLAEASRAREIDSLVKRITAPVTRGGYSSLDWFAEIAPEYLSGNGRSFLLRIKRYGFKHLLQCCRWLVSPFVVKCYMGLLWRALGMRIG